MTGAVYVYYVAYVQWGSEMLLCSRSKDMGSEPLLYKNTHKHGLNTCRANMISLSNYEYPGNKIIHY